MASHISPHVVYRLYDATDLLVYIGVTSDFPMRLAQHQRQSHFGSSVVSYALAHYSTRAEADHAERAAILAESPPGNSTVKVKRRMPPGETPQPVHVADRCVSLNLQCDLSLYAALATRARTADVTPDQMILTLLRAALRFEERERIAVFRTADDWRE